MNSDELLLPPATRLLHIGPYKTGTTALQNAFHFDQALLAPHGVHYAGAGTQPAHAALAVIGGRGRKGDRPPRPEDWEKLVAEVRAARSQRVVISSEFLSSAGDAAIRRVVAEITGGPLHVVVTLRPIAKIAPSQWQQYVQNGIRTPYATWLEAMFSRSPDKTVTPSFWQRHSHGELIRRWAEIVGPQNLTVVVVDENDRTMLLRTFEAFVGLPQGLLTPHTGTANRSLALGEVELVRLLNEHFHQNDWSGAWSDDAYARFVREGVARQMRIGHQPGPDEPRLTTPDWALERAAEIGSGFVDTIRSTGVRVVGDLSTLMCSSSESTHQADPDRTGQIPAISAALAVFGAMTGRREARAGERVAATLPVLQMVTESGPGQDHDEDQDQMPWVSVDQAAQAVIGALAGRDARDEFAGLPRVPADAAMLAAVAGSRAAGAGTPADPLTAQTLIDAMGIEPPSKKTKSDRSQQKPARARAPVVPNTSAVEDVPARDLLKIVALRGKRRIRHRLRG